MSDRPATAPARRGRPAVPFSAAAGGRRGSTTRPTTRTPAASPSWPTPGAAARARSWPPGLTALHNLDHRGAAGAEPNSGDGAGILTQVPDALLRAEVGFDLPPVGEYAVGIAFLPGDDAERADRVADVERLAGEEGLAVLGWRELPVDPDGADIGPTARAVMPHFAQLFVAETMGARADEKAFGGNVTCNGVTRLERRAFVLRKRAERAAAEAGSSCYIPSLSSPHDHLQGHADHRPAAARSSPTCATSATSRRSRWCTAGSPPTPSRAGRWPTRSG